MITFVGIKPEKFIKKTGNPGKPLIEFVAAAYDYDFLEVESIDDIPKDKPMIMFSDHGKESIDDFDFPEDAYYVFGPDWDDVNIRGYNSVRIPVTNDRFRAMFASQAASIVAWEAFKRKS